MHAENLGGVLCHLRGLADPCKPPVGVGSFVVLYVSEHEVVVWYLPAREHQREGEVAIPCRRLAAAWEALSAGQMLDEAALELHGEGVAGGRWLLALLAQVPGVRVQEHPLAISWSAERANTSLPTPRRRARGKTGRRPATTTSLAATASARAQSRAC